MGEKYLTPTSEYVGVFKSKLDYVHVNISFGLFKILSLIYHSFHIVKLTEELYVEISVVLFFVLFYMEGIELKNIFSYKQFTYIFT